MRNRQQSYIAYAINVWCLFSVAGSAKKSKKKKSLDLGVSNICLKMSNNNISCAISFCFVGYQIFTVFSPNQMVNSGYTRISWAARVVG